MVIGRPFDPGLLGFFGGLLFVGLLDRRRRGRRVGEPAGGLPLPPSGVCCAASGAASISSGTEGGGETKRGSHDHVLLEIEDKNASVSWLRYVSGTASTVSKVTVTFGSVFSMPSIAVGGLMP